MHILIILQSVGKEETGKSDESRVQTSENQDRAEKRKREEESEDNKEECSKKVYIILLVKLKLYQKERKLPAWMETGDIREPKKKKAKTEVSANFKHVFSS